MIYQRAYLRQAFKRVPPSKRLSSSLRPRGIDVKQPFEEEKLPWYKPDQFYPVQIGQILRSKYKVIGKLGYGAYSTTWLCRDLEYEYDWCYSSWYAKVFGRRTEFVALKVCTRDVGSRRMNREIGVYEHLASLHSDHVGQAFIRGLFDTFEIEGSSGRHLCLVQPPMHMTVQELQRHNPSRRLNKQLLNWTLHNSLQALSFLHEEADVVHTDITPSNIMFSIEDATLLEDFEQAELAEPSLTKVIDETRTIYASRALGLPRGEWGQPVLCDLGEARIGSDHRGLIQPELYRAPEVLFNMQWSFAVDIWNVAVLIWDLFEGKHLFHALDENGESSATHHVAEMIGFMGMPPLEFIFRSKDTMNVFNEEGHWKRAGGVDVPPWCLEQSEDMLDRAEKAHFLDFIRLMLRWLPEEREHAGHLLQHPWMKDAISTE